MADAEAEPKAVEAKPVTIEGAVAEPPKKKGPQADLEAIVLEAMKGRVPISQQPSSAATWVPLDTKDLKVTIPDPADPANPNKRIPVDPHTGVPRPDKSSTTLAWLSALPFTGLLGIDHFYLRSPGTGILKLLSNVLAPGLWYFWDIMQEFNEWDRVKLYGLSAPFDMIRGIGQGMLYPGTSNSYAQTQSFGIWVLTILFGITGADCMYMGNFWLGLRKMFVFIFLMSFALPAIINPGQITFFVLIGLFFMAPEIIGLLVSWFNDLFYVFSDSMGVFKTGLPMPTIAYDGFGWFTKMYENKPGEVDPNSTLGTELAILKKHFMFNKNGITANEMKRMFWIAHGSERAGDKEPDKGPPGFPTWTLIVRFVGVFFGWVYFAIKAIWFIFFPPAIVTEVTSRTAATVAEASGAVAIAQARANAAAAMENIKAVSNPGAAAAAAAVQQTGGAYPEELSTEAQILGATVVALIAGGSLKGLVDYLMTP